MKRKANPKAIHIAKSHKADRTSQNLAISMSCHRTKKMKIVANLKEKYMEMIECQCLTKAIRNAGKVLNMNIIAINEICGKLKINRFKNPHYA